MSKRKSISPVNKGSTPLNQPFTLPDPDKKESKSFYNNNKIPSTMNKIYSSIYISASQLHNYFMDDPLLDFLNKYGQKLGFQKDDGNYKYNFSKFIMNLGNIWEMKVVEHIISLVGISKACAVKDDNFQPFDISNDITRLAKEHNIPVIFQAYLRKDLYDDKFHGHVDILCHIDYLDKIFDFDNTLNGNFSQLIDDYKSKNILYVPIDIKTSNFTSETTLNTPYYEYISGQLHLYTKMNNPSASYGILIGRQPIVTGRKLSGYIVNVDNNYIVEKIKACSKWLRRVESEGNNWTLLPKPSVRELYPNMKNTQDSPWTAAKKLLARELKEITDLYYCNLIKRNYCHSREVYSYDDPEFVNAIQSTFRNSPRLRPIGSEQKNDENSVINKIINIANVQNGKLSDSKVEKKDCDTTTKYIYLDIETVYNFYSCIYDEYSKTTTDIRDNYITQIGIGYINSQKKWVYKSFDMKFVANSEEAKIINECKTYLQVVLDMCEKICFVYFTKAENKILNNIIKDLITEVNSHCSIEYLDLHEEWLSRDIYFKDLINFRLKSIISALNRRGYTDLTYDNLVVNDGVSAMSFYMIEDKIAKDAGKSGIDEKVLQHIRDYNATDCKALYEIHKNLYNL